MKHILSFFVSRPKISAGLVLSALFASALLVKPLIRTSEGQNLSNEKSTVFRVSSRAAAGAKSPFAAVSANSPEILLAPEDDSSYIDGSKRISNRTGYPAAIYRTDFRVSAAAPEAQAREYLSAEKSLLGLSELDLQNLKLHAVRTDEAGTVVRLRQTWKGLPVNKNAEITVHIGRAGVVDFVMNGFVYGVALEDTTSFVAPANARAAVVQYLGARGKNIEQGANELMVLRHQDKDHLVYRVDFLADEPVGEWEAYVDAKTGELLKVEDVALYDREKSAAKKRPNLLMVSGTGNVFDPDPLTTAQAAYGGSYVDGNDANAAVLTAQLKSVTLPDITLSAGTYSLVGPYAEIRDNEAPNKGLFTQASPTFAFDRNADNFEAVNTYYHIDSAMRYLNVTLGLNIMPYQYAGGVRFDPSGLSGADNSHYTSGNGQLAFGEGGVDDAEDADVIVHELGHGIHDWVTAGGLSQVNGLSEGTGDYWAGSYSRAKGGWTSAQAAFFWVFNWDGHNPFWSGRVLNYGPTYPAGLVNQIHTDGQIWATANMKIWDDIGQQKADKAFWSGLGMTNAATNQNDAANAVYTAAVNMGYTGAERLAMRTRLAAAGFTLAPTAANVSVGGRVLESGGAGIRNAVVTLTDSSGMSRTARTGTFGYFNFDNVEAGRTYTISVSAKRFVFANPTRVLTVNDSVADLDFSAGM